MNHGMDRMDDMTDTEEFPVFSREGIDMTTDRAGGLLKGETLMSSIVLSTKLKLILKMICAFLFYTHGFPTSA